MAKRFAVFLTKLWEKTKPVPGDSTDVFFRTNNSECMSSLVYAEKALWDLNLWFLQNKHINRPKKETDGTLSGTYQKFFG